MTEDGQESHTPFCHFWFYFFCDYTMRQSAREMSFVDDLSACDPSLKLCADFLWKQSYLFQRFSFNFINALRSFHYYYFFKPRSLSGCWWVSLFSSISKSIESPFSVVHLSQSYSRPLYHLGFNQYDHRPLWLAEISCCVHLIQTIISLKYVAACPCRQLKICSLGFQYPMSVFRQHLFL